MASAGTREAEGRALVYATDATIRARGEATDEQLLQLILARAPDPQVFESAPPFTWQAEASSGRLDSYYTRMDERSLRNYAKDADDGVMFLDSHDFRQLGLGQSIRGQFVAGEGKVDLRRPDDANPHRVLIDFFTIPGLKLGRADSDSFIRGARSGMLKDVSIGFDPGRFECNICSKDPFDWWSMECLHIPGAYYDEAGANVVPRGKDAVQAFAWVREARLLEVSAVYAGATPGAYIQKAKFLVEAGQVERKAVGMLERQLRVTLPTPALAVPSFAVIDGKLMVERGGVTIDGRRYDAGMEVAMPKRKQRADEPAEDEEAMAPVDEVGEVTPPPAEPVEPDDDDEADEEEDEEEEAMQAQAAAATGAIRRARAALARAEHAEAETIDLGAAIDAMHRRIRDLEPRALLGDAYRARVVDAALEAGVRAEGKEFDPVGWRDTFGGMRVEQIERLAKTWDKAGERAGGRRTADVGIEAPAEAKARENGAVDPAQYSTR